MYCELHTAGSDSTTLVCTQREEPTNSFTYVILAFSACSWSVTFLLAFLRNNLSNEFLITCIVVLSTQFTKSSFSVQSSLAVTDVML